MTWLRLANLACQPGVWPGKPVRVGVDVDSADCCAELQLYELGWLYWRNAEFRSRPARAPA